MVALGDLDGDGLRDLAVALARGAGAETIGGLRVVSARDGTTLAFLETPAHASVEAIAAAGDWNGDGRDDLLVVTTKASVVVDALTNEELARLPGGHSACTGRDADGDGVADVAIGAWDSVTLVSGATRRTIDTWEKRVGGFDAFASSVAFAALLGRGGGAELAVGSPDLGIDGGLPEDVGELLLCASGRRSWLYAEEGRRQHEGLGFDLVALLGPDGDRLAVGTYGGVRVYAAGAFR